MNGLQLFRAGTDGRFRRRRLVFVFIWLLLAVLLTWPVYSYFSGIYPLVLGLPLSFAWMILALAIQFAALLWLFLGEPEA